MIEERLTRRLAIGKIDRYRCTGCGVCAQSCLNDVIRMKAGKANIVYQGDCSQCFVCIEDCPRNAISMGWIEKGSNDNIEVEARLFHLQEARNELSMATSGKSENFSRREKNDK